MWRRTLTFRLVAASSLWIGASLLIAGGLLVLLFRAHIERRFDQQLYDHLEELVAASEISAAGALQLTWIPSDPRFNRPHSGWYWQISEGTKATVRSDSLWRSGLKTDQPQPGTGFQTRTLQGPEQEPLRALTEDITLPAADRHFTFIVAGPVSDIQRDVAAFTTQLAATLGVLGVGLLAAVVFQVRFGLRPLRRMRRALADVRSGRSQHLSEGFPEEVLPAVTELNALLDHNATMLQRARTQAGNLAHALKNPLTVIRNEAGSLKGERGQILRDQVSILSDTVDRHLARARTAGTAQVLGARSSLYDTIEDLRFSMERLYQDRGLSVEVAGLNGLSFQGDQHDLEEMVGNLMDNACKWARTRVSVSTESSDGRLIIVVEDDGPGIPEERRTAVVERGRRLDEAVPGSGLGLDIVQDIADLYRGSLRLSTSSLGGLRAELDLPSAD